MDALDQGVLPACLPVVQPAALFSARLLTPHLPQPVSARLAMSPCCAVSAPGVANRGSPSSISTRYQLDSGSIRISVWRRGPRRMLPQKQNITV